MIITHTELKELRRQRDGEPFAIVVDFGRTPVSARVAGGMVIFDNGLQLSLDERLKENFCYRLDETGVLPIAFYDEETRFFYKLVPTPDWPTIAISSTPMHRLGSPRADTAAKINVLKPYGAVLDTCMGLGYTAIAASARARKVYTFERDENVCIIARCNPWSRELFSTESIETAQKNVSACVDDFNPAYFDCIMHDPPTFRISPEMYTVEFYQRLLRILKAGGRMFHYAPWYKKTHGYDFPAKVEKNLKKAGFHIVEFSQEASGFLVKK